MMKHKIRLISLLLALVGILSFSGCGDGKLKIDNTDTYVFGQDSQESFIKYQCSRYFAESEDAIYYENSDNNFLYVIDKATHKCQPLCDKSDCLHDRETSSDKMKECTAYLGPSPNVSSSLVYYGGDLYFHTFEDKVDKDGVKYELQEICKISTDGRNRETVFSIRDFNICNFKIHRGYIYFEGIKRDTEGAAVGTNTALYKVSADGSGEMIEMLPYYDYNVQNGMIVSDWRFYGNHLFLWISKLNDKSGNETQYIINYDLQTDKWENLNEKLSVKPDSMSLVFNDKLIFASGTKIYECDFNGDNQREILDGEEVLKGYKYYTPFTNDGENLIISVGNDDEDADVLIFCDKEYNVTLKKMPYEFSAEVGFCDTCFIDYDFEEQTLYCIDKTNTEKAEKIYTFEQ